jgi:hypothetical protein
MPSTSAKQERTMRAAAHNPEFAKKMGIPQDVAKEYEKADEAKHKTHPSGDHPHADLPHRGNKK